MIFEDDCVLVLAETHLKAEMHDGSDFQTTRKATYVFKRVKDQEICVIDNSYGTALLKPMKKERLHFFVVKFHRVNQP